MTSWTQTEWKPGRRVWERNLGTTETCYYWEGIFKGTFDTIMHVHLRSMCPDDTEIHAPANVRRAWSSVKRRYPLLAAELREDGYDIRFVVREENVSSLREDDVTFATVLSFHSAEQFVEDLLDNPPPLFPKRLARVYVLARTDQPDNFHVVLVLAHAITDGCSTTTILRAFFQTLASSYDPVPLPIPLRLQMCLPSENRLYHDGVSLATKRWRRAIGFALQVVRLNRFKGGHIFPGKFTTTTRNTPAKSRVKVFTFSREMTNTILSNCHRHGFTLTCASYAISQVVWSRVLCRRYLRGEISDEEWEYRIREPMFFNGQLDLRPHMDQDWFQSGGSGEIGINVSVPQYILPFMPLGGMRRKDLRELELVDGAPHFPELMSMGRFLHRCQVVKSQVQKLFNHPRFVDICSAVYQLRLPVRHATADAWRSEQNCQNAGSGKRPKGTLISFRSLGQPMVQDGSSLGNMDTKLPLAYPLPATHPLSPVSPVLHPHRAGYDVHPIPAAAVRASATPRLEVAYWRTHLRIRPAMMYLGSVTVRGQLQFFMFYDANVYDAEVVAEWMAEMREGVRWYLGEPRGGRETATRTVPTARL